MSKTTSHRSGRRAPVLSRVLAGGLLAGGVAMGCATSASKRVPEAPRPTGAAEAARAARAGREATEAREQKEAQEVWCSYLKALYLRSQEGSTQWPRYEECTRVRSTAAPAMLRRTADCARTALDHFEGDPFTPEYAAEVGLCGKNALDAMRAPREELVPVIAAACQRAVACGQSEYAECTKNLEEGVGPHLQRAIGAMNQRARRELRGCLETAACDNIGHQIATCLEPMLDGLLWLPE